MPKILVADDNANIQKMVVLAFDDRGIEVITVGNGEAAVRRIPDLQPDLILADIFMPVRNGYEVCEFVKKDQRFSHIPVILLVGAFDPLDEKEARRVGADGVLKKPFVPPDPLIAMVMSALEKNPKVVAELAKAKEAKEVLPPEPEPVLEVPSRPKPKPLPEFPEPSPEEAAVVYGFGKGVRALDDEQAASLSKTPIAQTEETEEAEFDGTSTATDWRRDAMDFEVPSESANTPAFSSNADLEQVTFPSESEFPAKRVRVRQAKEVEQPAAKDDVPVFMDSEESAPVFIDPPAEPEAAAELPNEVATPEIMEASALQAEAEAEPEPEPERVPEATSDPVSDSIPEPLTEQDAPPSETPHWMDALAPFEARQTGGGWMTSLSQPKPATVIAKSRTESLAAQDHAEEVAAQGRTEEFTSLVVASPSTLESVEAHADASTEAIAIVEEPEASALISTTDEEEPSSTNETAVSTNDSAASAPDESWFSPAPPVFKRIYDPVSAPVAIAPSAPDRGLEVNRADDTASLSFKDPGLVEPAGVRVTPEPLLIDDNATQAPSDYGVHAEHTAPPHSFFAPASGEPAREEHGVGQNETPAPSFELEPSSNRNGERIATAPPPNREALSEIPFLMPPADFDAELPESTSSRDGLDVDEVVRRVLEKLQPQLNDLLSQGVLKPLIENLLQNELSRKEK